MRRNEFDWNADRRMREQIRNRREFGGGWARDWDSDPRRTDGAYHESRRDEDFPDHDSAMRESRMDGHAGIGRSVYQGGNYGRGDYGRGSSFGRRGYYDRGSYYSDASRYTPRFHERTEYDEYDRSEERFDREQRQPRRDSEHRRFDQGRPAPDREYNDRFGSNYRQRTDERWGHDRPAPFDRSERGFRRGFGPADAGGQFGGRNTW